MLVICNGMIRSGSTLQYNLARSLVESAKIGRGEGFLDEADLLRADDRLEVWAANRRHHVVKTHGLHPRLEWWVRHEPVRVLYIHRDLRDVAVSALGRWRYSWPDLLEVLDAAVETERELHRISLLDGASGRVLVQRYESVMEDLGATTAEIASFLEIDVGPELVSDVAERWSLDASRRRLREIEGGEEARPEGRVWKRLRSVLARLGLAGKAGPMYDEDTLLHPGHISEGLGAVGGWRTELDPERAEELSRRHREWLAARGYDSHGSGPLPETE